MTVSKSQTGVNECKKQMNTPLFSSMLSYGSVKFVYKQIQEEETVVTAGLFP